MPDRRPPAHVVDRLRAAGCVFAEDEARLATADAPSAAVLEDRLARRESGEPLEHVLGWVALGGRRFEVGPGVFVPRQRSEHLVREAAARLPRAGVLVDACCGSGALGALVADLAGAGELHATDVDQVAVACARRNLAALGGHAYVGDLLEPLPPRLRERVDVIVANVPYVPTGALGAMPPEAREHEPAPTHDGGPDGLDVARRLLHGARGWLAPGGHLLVEIHHGQADPARAAAVAAGLVPTVVTSDRFAATALAARRPHLPPSGANSTS